MRVRLPLAIALLLFLAAPATAQEGPARPDVRAGTRVRITTASNEHVRGTIMALRADSVVLAVGPNGDTRALARTEVARIDRSAGMKGHALLGGALGFLGGAGVGALIGYGGSFDPFHDCDSRSQTCNPVSNTLDKAVDGAADVAVGALVGGAVGVLIGSRKHEQWRRVSDEKGVRVGIHPVQASRVALTLSLRR